MIITSGAAGFRDGEGRGCGLQRDLGGERGNEATGVLEDLSFLALEIN